MKKAMKKVFFTLAIAVGGVAAASVLSAAMELAEGIEHLDTELHAISAPAHVINLVHHTEETTFEFVSLVREGAPKHVQRAEYQHIRLDVAEVRREMKIHRYFRNARVEMETWHVYSASRQLDHALFMGGIHGHI